ncbi:hypothetical protein AWC38_SpisGene10304 [Stylophora pistillata]|uniref:Uncharacterized protein n=1 Tax=Stylophora pistillata TaxID=50429 RepID=A0A2B4S8G2_STYPI|nr:hypothetical protein AWC38_SpisGene10304 [Stylophora pistillata]
MPPLNPITPDMTFENGLIQKLASLHGERVEQCDEGKTSQNESMQKKCTQAVNKQEEIEKAEKHKASNREYMQKKRAQDVGKQKDNHKRVKLPQVEKVEKLKASQREYMQRTSVRKCNASSYTKCSESLVQSCIPGVRSIDNTEWICNTCHMNIKEGKLPQCSKENGNTFPDKPPVLDLTTLEERLISPRIPFMKIRELPRGGQLSIHGNVVNVPSDVNATVHISLGEGVRVLKNLRGSPAYFQKCKKDLFAMILQLGNPTWFCCFSAAETTWKHLLQTLGRILEKKEYSDEEINSMTWQQKSDLIQRDPITCARNFEHVVQLFIQDVLKSDVMPIGEIVDYFYRVEFQQRGSPHIHGLFWVKDAPQYDKSSDQYIINLANTSKMEPLVNQQLHRHAKTSKKMGQKVYRFNLPLPPMQQSIIFTPLEEYDTFDDDKQKEIKENVEKIKEQLDSLKCGQRGMSKLLEKATEEVKSGNKVNSQKVRHIGNKFLNAIEISAQEAAYLVLQMPMWRSTRDFQFVNTSHPDERTFLLKKLDKIKELPDNSCDIESDNIIKHYQRRPKQLENSCLVDFVSWFNCVSDNETGTDFDDKVDIPSDNFLPETLFDANSNDDDPYDMGDNVNGEKNEPQLKMKGAMKLIKALVCSNRQNYEYRSEVLDKAMEDLDFDYSVGMCDNIAPNAQHINKQDSATEQKPSELFGCFDPGNNKQHSQYDLLDDIAIFPRCVYQEELLVKQISNDEYRQLVRSLNEKQRQFFYHALHSVKISDDPVRRFLSGGAGVGKSTVTNALYEALLWYLNSIAGENRDEIKVIKAAPIGKRHSISREIPYMQPLKYLLIKDLNTVHLIVTDLTP